MGCDIHFKLERCIHRVDSATIAARVTLLMLAERAKREQKDDGNEPPQPAFQRLPPELWQRCAKLTPVTNGQVHKWLPCLYADWVFTDENKFIQMSSEHKQKLAIAMSEKWAALIEQHEQENGAFEDEDEEQEFKWENEDEVYYNALVLIQPASVKGARSLRAAAGGYYNRTGYWDDCLADLEMRNYNRFGLFSQGVGSSRSQPGLKIKQLGCVRSGWPADVNETDAADVHDEYNLHSHGCATLAGLFAVDWDISVSSASHSARALRPTGQFVGTPYQCQKTFMARRFGLKPDPYGQAMGQAQEPSLANHDLSRTFDLSSGGTPLFPPGWDGMSERQKCEATLEKVMEKLVARGIVDAEDDGDNMDLEDDDDTAADAGSSAHDSNTRRMIMGDAVCAGLIEMEERMTESGASPADFRLLICFDN